MNLEILEKKKGGMGKKKKKNLLIQTAVTQTDLLGLAFNPVL